MGVTTDACILTYVSNYLFKKRRKFIKGEYFKIRVSIEQGRKVRRMYDTIYQLREKCVSSIRSEKTLLETLKFLVH